MKIYRLIDLAIGDAPTIDNVELLVDEVTFDSPAKYVSSDVIIENINGSKLAELKFYDAITLIGVNAGVDATYANNSNFLGVGAGYIATNAAYSNFLGASTGFGASSSPFSNFLGAQAGYNAINAAYSNFLGFQAGYGATYANNSNFLGVQSGYNAINAAHSNFIGYFSGKDALNASYSNFLGRQAGHEATNAYHSNFLGFSAGYGATNAYHSNFLGFKAGYSFTGNNVGSNNIIIGTNISLPNGVNDSINIGAVLFGVNTHGNIAVETSITPKSDGRIGIGVVTPTAVLELRASTSLDAALKLNIGSAPTSPNDGDIWLESNTSTGLKIRLNGITYTVNLT
jgi:hypothetical protein